MNYAPIAALINFIDYVESRMSLKEFMRLIRERLPIEEVGPELGKLADVLIKEAPQPSQVIKAIGCILSGGFPFDATSIRK